MLASMTAQGARAATMDVAANVAATVKARRAAAVSARSGIGCNFLSLPPLPRAAFWGSPRYFLATASSQPISAAAASLGGQRGVRGVGRRGPRRRSGSVGEVDRRIDVGQARRLRKQLCPPLRRDTKRLGRRRRRLGRYGARDGGRGRTSVASAVCVGGSMGFRRGGAGVSCGSGNRSSDDGSDDGSGGVVGDNAAVAAILRPSLALALAVTVATSSSLGEASGSGNISDCDAVAAIVRCERRQRAVVSVAALSMVAAVSTHDRVGGADGSGVGKTTGARVWAATATMAFSCRIGLSATRRRLLARPRHFFHRRRKSR